MNTVILHKDEKIKALVDHLEAKYGADNFKIRDFWDGDDAVIGFIDKSEKYLVYVSTFGLGGSRYFVELENLIKDNEAPYVSAGEFEDIELVELEKIFAEHLRISSI
jgi:hypothetical protein